VPVHLADTATAAGPLQVVALARHAYRHGTAEFQLVADRSALLVIDMQRRVRPAGLDAVLGSGGDPTGATNRAPGGGMSGMRRPDGVHPVSATHGYLDRPASGAGMPNRYSELDATDPAWFLDGRIWQELAPEPAEVVIHKPSYGAFYDTPLERILRNLGRDTVIISGTLTNLWCGTTARQAYERGFQVVVGSGVTATNDPAVHEYELMTLRYGLPAWPAPRRSSRPSTGAVDGCTHTLRTVRRSLGGGAGWPNGGSPCRTAPS
jgi:nicotinamidase-related amidase